MIVDVEALQHSLAERREIAVAYLYGSTARGEAAPSSDIDVGVLLAEVVENPLRYRARLAEELTRAAGGVTVEVVLLDEVSPALAGRVVRDGRLLLCRDDVRRVRFETDALRREFDTIHLRRLYDRVLACAIRQGRFYG